MDRFRMIWAYFSYGWGLLLMEMTLLYSFPKRKRFPLRITLGVILTLALCGLFTWLLRMPGISFLRSLSLFVTAGLTFFCLFFCFKGNFWSIFSAAIGGMALQHFAYHISLLLDLIPGAEPYSLWIEFFSESVCATISVFTLGRQISIHEYYKTYDKRMILVATLGVILCLGIIRLFRLGHTDDIYIKACISVYAIFSCIMILGIQFVLYRYLLDKEQYEIEKRILLEQKKQYETSQANIEFLNEKYHDLKKMIQQSSKGITSDSLAEMSEELSVYDSIYHTGNNILDSILNEKQVRCRKENISLTFLGDGNSISFLKPMDIYSLFGNALDNALEASESVLDPHKRVISVVLETKGEFVYLNVKNYFHGERKPGEETLSTTKKQDAGYHGFGMKSMARIAKEYDGRLSYQIDSDIFTLSVYLLWQSQEYSS